MKIYQSLIVLQLAIVVSTVSILQQKDVIWPEYEEDYDGDPYLKENKGIEKVRDAALRDGDIVMSEETEEILFDEKKNEKRGAMIEGVVKLWMGNPPIVPYVISSDLANVDNDAATIAIEAGISDVEEKSCINFVQRTNENDYITFVMEKGCWSFLGKQGGSQPISLAPTCWSKSVVAHEIMHALGFLHEQSRPDRDDFVEVLFGNMAPDSQRQFKKYDNSFINSLGEKYDYRSVMHYRGDAFSNNGQPTMRRLDDPSLPLGVSDSNSGLTESDATQLNLLYKCGNVPPTEGPETSTEKPEPPTDKPEPPTEKPEPPTDKPEPPTRRPPRTGIPTTLCQRILKKLQRIINSLKRIGTRSQRRRRRRRRSGWGSRRRSVWGSRRRSGWGSRRRSGWEKRRRSGMGSQRKRDSGGVYGSRRRSGSGSNWRFFRKRGVEEGDNEMHERKKRWVLSDLKNEDVQEQIGQKLANLMAQLDENDFKPSGNEENDAISPDLQEELMDVLKNYENRNDEDGNSDEDENNLNEDAGDQDEDIEEEIEQVLDDAIDNAVDDIRPTEEPANTTTTTTTTTATTTTTTDETEKPTPPTEGPTPPTEGPTPPTEGPTPPTEGPTPPTEGPTPPTEGPTLPTEGPTLPTEKPTPPTEKPTSPTEGPTLPTEGPLPSTSTLPSTTRSPEIICKDLIDNLKLTIQDLIWNKIGGRGIGRRRRRRRRRSYLGRSRWRNAFAFQGDAKGGLIEVNEADDVSSKSDTKNKKLDNIENILAQLNEDDDEEDLA